MNIPVYIINLDRSKDRFEVVARSAESVGLDYHRISAVDGSKIDIQHSPEIDVKRFRRRHGKNILPGEAGCYLSHLRVLSVIANGEDPYAVIAEDDVGFDEEFVRIINKLSQVDGWDMIKFSNHRNRIFRKMMDITDNVSIGRCLHGPLGSSAAYMVTREGAKKLLEKLTPMSLPYDVALERGWSGYKAFSTNKNIVKFCGVNGSTIVKGRKTYHNMRLPKWKRIGTLFFRISDYIRRIIYGLQPSHLKLQDRVKK